MVECPGPYMGRGIIPNTPPAPLPAQDPFGTGTVLYCTGVFPLLLFYVCPSFVAGNVDILADKIFSSSLGILFLSVLR